MRIFSFVLIAALLPMGSGARVLNGIVVPLKPPIAQTGIVGRASCEGATWLLNQSAELIQLPRGSDRPRVRQVRDFREGDRLSGLACLADGSLWTLQGGHVLARLTPDGSVAERHAFLFPQVQLFGVSERLIFLGLPIVANRPLFAASRRDRPERVEAWSGLTARSNIAAVSSLIANLAACGIGVQGRLPCWFADHDDLTISDGALSHTVSLPSLRKPDIDQLAPIRDAALLDEGGLWVLAASSALESGRRVGGRLIRTDAAGVEQRSLTLPTAARLITWADADGCVLLTVSGDLIVVRDTPGRNR